MDDPFVPISMCKYIVTVPVCHIYIIQFDTITHTNCCTAYAEMMTPLLSAVLNLSANADVPMQSLSSRFSNALGNHS